MSRFIDAYGGTQWGVWVVIFCILSTPFWVKRIGQLSIVWLQIANFLLAFCFGAGLSGTCQPGMTGNNVLTIAVFSGFGIGYSLIAVRRENPFEQVLGWLCICLFVLLPIGTVITGIQHSDNQQIHGTAYRRP